MSAVTGDKEILRNLKKAGVGIVDGLGAALMKEGFSIWREGAKRTPVKAGILRRSWYVAPPVTGISARDPEVEVGVGTKYATDVHEDLAAQHPRGGQAKYISSVVDERRSGYVKRIGDWTWDFFRRGIGVASLPKLAPSKPSAESEGV